MHNDRPDPEPDPVPWYVKASAVVLLLLALGIVAMCSGVFSAPRMGDIQFNPGDRLEMPSPTATAERGEYIVNPWLFVLVFGLVVAGIYLLFWALGIEGAKADKQALPTPPRTAMEPTQTNQGRQDISGEGAGGASD